VKSSLKNATSDGGSPTKDGPSPSAARRRSFATADLPEEEVKAIAASRMDPRHAHLDRLLEDP
jgi:hypothetical protein